MGYSRVLIDTSVIIDYIRKQNKEQTLFWKLINRHDCVISTVTYFELYSGIKHYKDISRMDKLVSFLEVLDFDTTQAKEAAMIYRFLKKQNRLIEFRDIFIAASALSNHLPLATFNKKHFQRIDGLTLIL